MSTKANRDLWTAALRSGEYKQGKGTLLLETGEYCCLGVACQVFLEETGEGRWSPSTDEPGLTDFIVSDTDWARHVMPETVRDWLGLKTAGGEFKRSTTPAGYETGTASLFELNDVGASFAHIADKIDNDSSLLKPDERTPDA